jgi:uncharacterized protein GlcG (DUF336 family)
MASTQWRHLRVLSTAALISLFSAVHSLSAQEEFDAKRVCKELPDHERLTGILKQVVKDPSGNGGLGNDLWATIVNRDGVVCVVTFSGEDRGSQWPGSRVISAQKATTANAFSLPKGTGGALPGLALSTANLYAAAQPGGSLFGLQFSHPVDPRVAYRGNVKNHGEPKDPMVGRRVGGIDVTGGGLGLYDSQGDLQGGLGVSGDTSCTDHVVAWKVRDALALDHVPVGISPTGDDNIIFDMKSNPATGPAVSRGGFGHPHDCAGAAVQDIARELPQSHPIGANPKNQ